MLEGRSYVGLYRFLLLKGGDRRFTALMDSRVAKRAIAKGRSAARALRPTLLRACSYDIAGNLHRSFGFAPTRLNTADAPTREKLLSMQWSCSILDFCSLGQPVTIHSHQFSRAAAGWIRLYILVAVCLCPGGICVALKKIDLSGGLGEKVAEVLDSAFWLASQSFLVCPRWGLLQVNFKNWCAQPPPCSPDKLRIFCLRQPVRGSSRSQTAKVEMTTALAVSDAKCRRQQSKPPSQLRWWPRPEPFIWVQPAKGQVKEKHHVIRLYARRLMPGGSASCLWEPNLQQSSKSSRAASRGNIRSDLAAASASPTLRTPAHVIAITAPSRSHPQGLPHQCMLSWWKLVRQPCSMMFMRLICNPVKS